MFAHRTPYSARSLQRHPPSSYDLVCRRIYFRRGTSHGRTLWHADLAAVAASASMGFEESAHVTRISFPRLLQILRDRGCVALQFADAIRGVPGTAEAHKRGKCEKIVIAIYKDPRIIEY